MHTSYAQYMYVPSYSKRVLVLVNSVRLRCARDRLRRDITCSRRRRRCRRNGDRNREWGVGGGIDSVRSSTSVNIRSEWGFAQNNFLVEIKATKRYLLPYPSIKIERSLIVVCF